MEQAVVGLISHSQLDSAAKELWGKLDKLVVQPRTELSQGQLSSIQVQEVSIFNSPAGSKLTSLFKNTIRVVGMQTDYSIKQLLVDLEHIIRLLAASLPFDFAKALSATMMPTLSSRIKELWLDPAVPTSLDDMTEYQQTLAHVNTFAATLTELKWSGADVFQDWVSNAPRIWLTNRRERELDWIRHQLSLGKHAHASRILDSYSRLLVRRLAISSEANTSNRQELAMSAK